MDRGTHRRRLDALARANAQRHDDTQRELSEQLPLVVHHNRLVGLLDFRSLIATEGGATSEVSDGITLQNQSGRLLV